MKFSAQDTSVLEQEYFIPKSFNLHQISGI